MRYYNFALYASAEQIKENTTINLREYAYENPIAAVNNYMYKRLDNDVAFLTYREEGNTIFAVFVYDEKKKTFADAFSHATNVLKEDFSVNRIKTAPYEIIIISRRELFQTKAAVRMLYMIRHLFMNSQI